MSSKFWQCCEVKTSERIGVNPINLLKSDPINYRLKDIGPPTWYLGAKVACYTLPDSGVNTWYISAESYLHEPTAVLHSPALTRPQLIPFSFVPRKGEFQAH